MKILIDYTKKVPVICMLDWHIPEKEQFLSIVPHIHKSPIFSLWIKTKKGKWKRRSQRSQQIVNPCTWLETTRSSWYIDIYTEVVRPVSGASLIRLLKVNTGIRVTKLRYSDNSGDTLYFHASIALYDLMKKAKNGKIWWWDRRKCMT